jgi:tellurite resistance protein TehA-like permease
MEHAADGSAVYFFGFGFAFALALGTVFLAGFIGVPQQIKSHEAQPQASSTTTTIPHSSHLYLSPFFATQFAPPKTFVIRK